MNHLTPQRIRAAVASLDESRGLLLDLLVALEENRALRAEVFSVRGELAALRALAAVGAHPSPEGSAAPAVGGAAQAPPSGGAGAAPPHGAHAPCGDCARFSLDSGKCNYGYAHCCGGFDFAERP